MRRLARWALNAVTVLSLLLFVATSVLWVRSYRSGDEFHGCCELASDRGQLFVAMRERGARVPVWTTSPPPGDGTCFFRLLFLGATPRIGVPGLAIMTSPVYHWRIVVIRDAWLVALTALVPVVVVARVLRPRQQWRDGHCCSCRYDLTGNVSGVCPECGTAIVKR